MGGERERERESNLKPGKPTNVQEIKDKTKISVIFVIVFFFFFFLTQVCQARGAQYLYGEAPIN